MPFVPWEAQFKHWRSVTTRLQDSAVPPMKQSSGTPYSRKEILAAQDGRWPDRGQKCDSCGVMVPQFAEFADSDRARILGIVAAGQHSLAQAELEACTRAPPRFAKIWVLHSGRPSPRFSGPPCPQLRTASRIVASEAVSTLSRRLARAPPNRLLQLTAAPRCYLKVSPLARGGLPRARSLPPAASCFLGCGRSEQRCVSQSGKTARSHAWQRATDRSRSGPWPSRRSTSLP
jgi:hypothetical protein